MKKIWKKMTGIICAGGLLTMCLTGCGKDAAGSPEIPTQEIQQNNVVDGAQANNNTEDDEAQANDNIDNINMTDDGMQANKENNAPLEQGADNNVADDGASANRGDGAFLYGANLQGTVVEFSETGFTLSPASTEADGKVLAEAAPGSESDENNIQITYTDDTVFQIVYFSMSSQSEVSREDTDKESVKKEPVSLYLVLVRILITGRQIKF